jgi:hypothetical protein
MNCPGCNAELADPASPEGGIDEQLRVCQECGSLTVALADLNPLLLHHNLPGIESLGGRVVPDATTAVCRTCLVDLTLFEGGTRQDPQYYELCEECGSVFIEGESLDAALGTQQKVVAFFRKFVNKDRAGP